MLRANPGRDDAFRGLGWRRGEQTAKKKSPRRCELLCRGAVIERRQIIKNLLRSLKKKDAHAPETLTLFLENDMAEGRISI